MNVFAYISHMLLITIPITGVFLLAKCPKKIAITGATRLWVSINFGSLHAVWFGADMINLKPLDRVT